jgi:hypothetical protein
VFTNYKRELNWENSYKKDEESAPHRQPKGMAECQLQQISMLMILKEIFKEGHSLFEKISFLEMFARQQQPHTYAQDNLLSECVFSFHNYFSYQLKFHFGVFGDVKKTLIETLEALSEKF